MTTIEQSTPISDPWDQRVERYRARWAAAQATAQTALEDLVAVLFDKPLPSEPHVERFAGDVEVGDQVLRDDGWWLVTGALHGRSDADTVLTASRVGYPSTELLFAGNELLTTVRPS